MKRGGEGCVKEYFSEGLQYKEKHGTWDETGYRTMLYKKITQKTVISTYPVHVEIYGIPYMKKDTELREIPRNFPELHNTEFSGIPLNSARNTE
jgi:hypothetical protein